jgi:hypothetical protein
VFFNGIAKKLIYRITDTPDGGCRDYLGGNQHVQRATKLALQKVIRQHKTTSVKRGNGIAAAPTTLAAELITLHQQCEATGTTVADAVSFWFPTLPRKTLRSGCRTPGEGNRIR